jgi:3-oxoacyl-[acyl-carrier protein] reductase
MAQLDRKIAIVTGGASGFGAGIARSYLAEGARVVIADIDVERGRELARELGADARFIRCDVAAFAEVDALVKGCVDAFGAPDIVVNNAGTTHRNMPMLEVDEKTFDRLYAINVKSIYNMAHAVVPLMRKRRSGVILNVGSTAGIRPRPGLTWYNGSKAAVNLLSKSMAVELAPDGIRVNAICPVMGETGLLEQFMGMADTAENRARFVATIPLGRLSKPSDVAAVAVFLASDAAGFLTGIEFPVDGGRTV